MDAIPSDSRRDGENTLLRGIIYDQERLTEIGLDELRSGSINRGIADVALYRSADAKRFQVATILIEDPTIVKFITYSSVKYALRKLKEKNGDPELTKKLTDLKKSMIEELKKEGAVALYAKKTKGVKKGEEAEGLYNYYSNLAYSLLKCSIEIKSTKDILEILQEKAMLEQLSDEDVKEFVKKAKKDQLDMKVIYLLLNLQKSMRDKANKAEADELINSAVELIEDASRSMPREYVLEQLGKKLGIEELASLKRDEPVTRVKLTTNSGS